MLTQGAADPNSPAHQAELAAIIEMGEERSGRKSTPEEIARLKAMGPEGWRRAMASKSNAEKEDYARRRDTMEDQFKQQQMAQDESQSLRSFQGQQSLAAGSQAIAAATAANTAGYRQQSLEMKRQSDAEENARREAIEVSKRMPMAGQVGPTGQVSQFAPGTPGLGALTPEQEQLVSTQPPYYRQALVTKLMAENRQLATPSDAMRMAQSKKADAASAMDRYSEEIQKSGPAFSGRSGLSNTEAAIGGGAVGAAIGSAVPIVGTIAGAGLGAVAMPMAAKVWDAAAAAIESPDATNLTSAYSAMLVQAKNMADLGALNASDLSIMQGMLTDPTSMEGSALGKAGLLSEIKQAKNFLINKVGSALGKADKCDTADPIAAPTAKEQGQAGATGGWDGGSQARPNMQNIDDLYRTTTGGNRYRIER